MISWWWTDDKLITIWWCIDDELMMNWWMMNWWWTDDELVMYWRVKSSLEHTNLNVGLDGLDGYPWRAWLLDHLTVITNIKYVRLLLEQSEPLFWFKYTITELGLDQQMQGLTPNAQLCRWAVDRFTKRFLSDIDGSPHFLMEVYLA